MSNRKIVLIIVGIVATITLLLLVFVGGIIGVALYSVSNSEAANTARNFLKRSEKLRADIGEVKDFGSIVTGSVNVANDSGQATINLKVIGANETVNASVNMMFVQGREWRVVSASYVNTSGQQVSLQDPFDSKQLSSPLVILAA
jgi:Cytochrome oxidase complex assembly protein 1